MNKLKTIYGALSSTGLNVVYGTQPLAVAPTLPYIDYFELGSNNFIADNSVYHRVDRFEVQLYTENRDTTTEDLVESAIEEFVWEKNVDYLKDEKCYLITYNFEL